MTLFVEFFIMLDSNQLLRVSNLYFQTLTNVSFESIVHAYSETSLDLPLAALVSSPVNILRI